MPLLWEEDVMLKVKGKHNEAVIYSNSYDEEAINQIKTLCDLKSMEGAEIKVMPDYHAGKGCVIGFTAFNPKTFIPNLLGVDIGCGVLAVKVKEHIDLEKLGTFIKENIPTGFEVNETPVCSFPELRLLHCYDHLTDTDRIVRSLGTLGGGNHFIEVARDGQGYEWLIIHSGSRNLGVQVAQYYQDLADNYNYREELEELIKNTPPQERESAIQAYREENFAPKGLRHLSPSDTAKYLNDVKVCQLYASRNRWCIAHKIFAEFSYNNFDILSAVESVHNYYDEFDNVIRKGAISARIMDYCIIPINMRDGSLLCKGLGNKEWNYSAPHGAGRIMSRKQAKELLIFEEFKKQMEGIQSPTVCENTLDEAPMAYRTLEEILLQIGDTVEILDVLTPIFNYKG